MAPGRAAMLHCGWRGLADGIVEHGLARFGEVPAAAIGPGIGRCCYEVGDEVLGRFAGMDGVADGPMLDLRAIARRKLEAGGVTRIDEVDLCTSCRADLYFSHRRDGGVTGRQGGLVARAWAPTPSGPTWSGCATRSRRRAGRRGAPRANLQRLPARIAAAGRDPGDVEILAAVKYVEVTDLPALAE